VRDLIGPRFKVPVLVLIALVVHAQLLPDVRVRGVHPDLMLLVAVAGGIVAGPSAGAVLGFSVGLLTDLLFLETPLGLSAMVFCLVGYGVGLLQARAINRRDTLTEQLQTALNSRVLIEQAKGVLAERRHLDMEQSFTLLRSEARKTNRRLSELARAVVDGSATL